MFDSPATSLIAYLIAIVLSLAGGMMVGNLYGRMQNGYGADIVAILARLDDLEQRVQHLSDDYDGPSARPHVTPDRSSPNSEPEETP